MSSWKRYTWYDFEPNALAHLERLTDTRQKLAAAREEFDPVHTFVSELNCDWNGHPRGSRVMLDDQQVAIETREGKSRAATSNS
jgi:hypothetical protein